MSKSEKYGGGYFIIRKTKSHEQKKKKCRRKRILLFQYMEMQKQCKVLFKQNKNKKENDYDWKITRQSFRTTKRKCVLTYALFNV